MYQLELEMLFFELDREARRLRRWADNVETQMGMDYGVTPDHKQRPVFLEAVGAMSRAAENLDEAAKIMQKLTV